MGETRVLQKLIEGQLNFSFRGVREVSLKKEIFGRYKIQKFLTRHAICFIFYYEGGGSGRKMKEMLEVGLG